MKLNAVSLLSFLTLAAAPLHATAQEIFAAGIAKVLFFAQTDSTTASPDGPAFLAFVEGEDISPTFPSGARSVTAPNGTSRTFAFDEDRWFIEEEFDDQPDLDSAFPNGSYTLRLAGETLSIPLNGNAYPVTPLITSSVGRWVDGVLEITASQAAAGFYLQSNVSTGNGFSTLFIEGLNNDLEIDFEEETGFRSLRADLSPGLLVPGGRYLAELAFDNVVHGAAAPNLGPDAYVFGIYSAITHFEIQVVPDAARVAGVSKRAFYRQTDATTAAPDGGGFHAFLDGSANFPSGPRAVAVPGGATLPFVFEWDRWYVEEFFNSMSELDAEFPDGTYSLTFGGSSTALALSGGSYPNPPLAETTAGRWANGKLQLTAAEAAAGFTIRSASTGNGFLSFYLQGLNNFFEPAKWTQEDPNLPIVVEIAPGALTPGGRYYADLDFDHTVANASALGYELFALYTSSTGFEIEVLHPPVYDLGADFSLTSNPNGVWSYGYSATIPDPMAPDPVVLFQEIISRPDNVQGWLENLSLEAPSVAHNPHPETVQLGTGVFPPGKASLHPGPQGQFAIVRFEAPAYGRYRIESAFWGNDNLGTSTSVHLHLNGQSFYTGIVNGFGPSSRISTTREIFLWRGDIIDLAVGWGPNNSFFYDATGVDLAITFLSSVAVENPSFESGLFGFDIVGESGALVEIEATVNFADWTRLDTIQASPFPMRFNDAQTADFPQGRSYRLRVR